MAENKLDLIAQNRAKLLQQIEDLNKQEKEEIEKSKEVANKDLIDVINKYKLSGQDILNALLKARKISNKDLTEQEPIYLIDMKYTGEKGEKHFYFFEGKSIISDKAKAQELCSTLEKFKSFLTEEGKNYLNNKETKNVIVDFFNEYKPAGIDKWDGSL